VVRRDKPERTLYIVAYDIPSNRRRTKVHKTLCGFGRWTQYSLFECHVTDKELIALRERLVKLWTRSKIACVSTLSVPPAWPK